MAGTEADHPLLAGACQQVEMHHPGGAGHCRLTAEFSGSSGSEAEALAPGHGFGIGFSSVWQHRSRRWRWPRLKGNPFRWHMGGAGVAAAEARSGHEPEAVVDSGNYSPPFHGV
jgi:hypothetical protein